MNKKENLIKAIKSLDFETLDRLLDDDRSYMDVPKRTFLNALKKKVDGIEGLDEFESVEEGICNNCNKGCVAYKFSTKDQISLNLFFEEKLGEISDIYLCHDLRVNGQSKDDNSIYFGFYEEEKVGFRPTLEYLMRLQRIDGAMEEFNRLAGNGLVTVQQVIYWFDKIKPLALELGLDDPFSSLEFKAYRNINALYGEVSRLHHNFTNNHSAKMALRAYYEISANDEKSLVKWLLDNEDNYFFSLKKTDNWKDTGILILESEPNLVVDCSDCLESFVCNEIYYEKHEEIMTRYRPTSEHYQQSENGITYTLESFLKLHNKYTELFGDDTEGFWYY